MGGEKRRFVYSPVCPKTYLRFFLFFTFVYIGWCVAGDRHLVRDTLPENTRTARDILTVRGEKTIITEAARQVIIKNIVKARIKVNDRDGGPKGQRAAVVMTAGPSHREGPLNLR